jgi:hypothetical protein
MDWIRSFFSYFKQLLENQRSIMTGQREIRQTLTLIRIELVAVRAAVEEIAQAVVIHETVTLSAVLENPDGSTIQGDSQMKFLVPDSAKSNVLRVRPTDAAGFPSRIDGAIRFVDADDTLITITQNDDLSLRLDYLKTDPGTLVDFKVRADVDLGEGVKEVELPIELEFQAGETVGLGVTLEDVPPAEPVTA